MNDLIHATITTHNGLNFIFQCGDKLANVSDVARHIETMATVGAKRAVASWYRGVTFKCLHVIEETTAPHTHAKAYHAILTAN